MKREEDEFTSGVLQQPGTEIVRTIDEGGKS